MKLSEAVKPISYLKAHAAEVMRDVSEHRRTVVITLNGEAKAVLQDVHVYEELQASLAMLRLLAQSRKSARAGRLTLLAAAFRRVRRRVKRSDRG
ncbi:MAG: type II toxin-antitoxin system Phd/YefM family antitoxin [Deltaproteobacteria bacterium]|nr:type II toxin-antitoxin system Phd/YefM family antitoxin [Deltaproteobacteria bacterium]